MIAFFAVALFGLQDADVSYYAGPERDRWKWHLGMTLSYIVRTGLFRSSDGDGRFHLDFEPPSWPVALAAEFGIAGLTPDLDKVSGVDVWKADKDSDAQVADLDLGVRWTTTWPALGPARPMLAGGVAYFFAELNGLVRGERVSRYDRGETFGPWVEAAITWDLGGTWCLGPRIRWDYANMDLFGGKGDVGGFHAGAVVEVRF